MPKAKKPPPSGDKKKGEILKELAQERQKVAELIEAGEAFLLATQSSKLAFVQAYNRLRNAINKAK